MSLMAKTGPKPLPPDEVRSKVVSLKTTPPSRVAWEQAMKIKGEKSLNDWAVKILNRAAKQTISKNQ